MKKSTLFVSIILGIVTISFFSCKKSNEIELSGEPKVSLNNQKFPTLYNLSKTEIDNLTTLLRQPDVAYSDLLTYANSLVRESTASITPLPILQKKMTLSGENTIITNNTVDEFETTEITTSTTYYQPNIDTFDGYEADYYGWAYSNTTFVDLPKFTIKHRVQRTLPGRSTIATIEVPIVYSLAWNTMTHKSYHKIKTDYVVKMPKMYLTGVLGELHTEYETLSFMNLGGLGEYFGNADIKIRENRSIVTTTDGSTKIEVNAAGLTVGGTSSNGQTITQIRNVQGYFDYHSDIIFFGTNTGYHESLGVYESQKNGTGFNIYQLLNPVIGTTDEVRFTGINQN